MGLQLPNSVITEAIKYLQYLIKDNQAQIINKNSQVYLFIKDNKCIYELYSIIYRTTIANGQDSLSLLAFPNILSVKRQGVSLLDLNVIKAFFTRFSFNWVESEASWCINYTTLKQQLITSDIKGSRAFIDENPLSFPNNLEVFKNKDMFAINNFEIEYLNTGWDLFYLKVLLFSISNKTYISLVEEKNETYAIITDVYFLHKLYASIYAFIIEEKTLIMGKGLPYLMFYWQEQHQRWALNLSKLILKYFSIFNKPFPQHFIDLIANKFNGPLNKKSCSNNLIRLWYILTKTRTLPAYSKGNKVIKRTSFVQVERTINSWKQEHNTLTLNIINEDEYRKICAEYEGIPYVFEEGSKKQTFIENSLGVLGFFKVGYETGKPLIPIHRTLNPIAEVNIADYEKYYLPFLSDLVGSIKNPYGQKPSLFDVFVILENIYNQKKKYSTDIELLLNKLRKHLQRRPYIPESVVKNIIYGVNKLLIEENNPSRLSVLKNKAYSWFYDKN